MTRKMAWLFLFMVLATAPATSQEIPPSALPKEPPQAAVPPPPEAAPVPVVPSRPPERRLVPPPTARSGDMVSLNFNRADLVEVIHVLAQHLKLTYTIDPEVKGTVTIYSAEPLKREDLLPIFHQVLRMNGAVAVKTGELYRIAPIKDGKGLASPMAPGREDGFALQVVPVRFLSVGEMKRLLSPFVTPGGEILDYPRGNFLILVDLQSNIQRLLEIRDLIDVSVFSGTRMEVYQPKIASAEELALEMTKIMQAYASSTAQAEGFAAQFVPIPRINQLLIISHSEAAWTYVKRWLERVDTVGEGPGRRIFIYPVENGKAVELAEILNQVLGQAPVARRETPRTLQDLHRGTTPAPGSPRPSLPGLGGAGSTASPSSSAAGAFAVAPLPGQPPPAGVPAPPSPSTTTPALPGVRPQEQMRIVPDPATNSLIVYGTAQEFQNIKNILMDLDIMPRQVLLDVLVAEVTLGDDMRFGVEFEIKRRAESVGQIGSIKSDDVPLPIGGLFGSLSAANVSQGLTTVLARGQDFRAIINALMTDSRVKVLSSPIVLATDNRPARIQVGTEEPIPTGSVQSPVSGGTITSSTTIQYRNTGRILTIIPQVNSQGLVHLQIKAEVSQRGADVRVGQDSFPSFDTRDAETTAVVQDGETLVIGGIITDRRSRSRTGIPYLMDLPILGRFFGVTTDDDDRTELVMLITPHVIRNVEEARSVTEEFKGKLSTVAREVERMKKEQEEKRRRTMPPGRTAPGKESRTVPEKSSLLDRPANSSAAIVPAAQELVGRIPAAGARSASTGPEPVKARLQAKTEKQPLDQNLKQAIGTPSSSRFWAVQVKSHPDEISSSSLARTLTEQGYDARVVKASIQGQDWYRVQVGYFTAQKQAGELLKALQSKDNFSDAFIVSRSAPASP